MRPRVARSFAILLLYGVLMIAQNNETPAPQTPQPKPQFFAGTVSALSDAQITISRTTVGHSPEHRTFLINKKTKMNRSTLKVKSRVTVKYQHLADGDVALEIQPQPSRRSSKPL